MPFRLEFADRYRLWSELVHSNTDRVFVATEEPPHLGGRVPVELTLKGTPVRVVVVATVVGRRAAGGRFPGGIFLKFEPGEVEKCRRFLGLSVPGSESQGRKTPRVRCALEVAFVSHEQARSFEIRNLSESGMLCTAPAGIAIGERARLLLTLDDLQKVPVEAEVTWVRPQDRIAGLRFVDAPAESRRMIAASVERLQSSTREQRRVKPGIVVAEDDADIMAFLTRALARHGYEVQTASRGDEALALIRELAPEMVLMDILMPAMDGVEICKTMRADVELADVPVVFLSALEEQRLHSMAHDAGATDYLCKPVNLADLLNVVGKYLRTIN